MTPASAKAKGRRAQKAVVDAILEAFPALLPDDVRSASMGANGEDILLCPLARSLVPYSIECKARARAWADLHAGLAQASHQGAHAPLLVVKTDRKEPLAVLPLAAFLELLSAVPHMELPGAETADARVPLDGGPLPRSGVLGRLENGDYLVRVQPPTRRGPADVPEDL